MIAYLHGELTAKEPTYLHVECHGVGYLVRISLNTYAELKDRKTAKVYTSYQVKEDSHTLFGFASQQEQAVFDQLISVSGIGGTTALLVLSSMTAEELRQAIATADVTRLKKVKGIGEKTAGRIVLELKGKLPAAAGAAVPASAVVAGAAPALHGPATDALQALQSLGFTRAEAEKRLEKALQNADGQSISAEDLIKAALKA